MTHTLHTQKSLDALTWNEVQKIHASLGLKATANARTRRDYQKRIVAAMPQPVIEAEQTATAMTCATCPFAILLEDNRYECGAKVITSVTRGHWEAKDECYCVVAAQVQAETTEPAAEVEAPAASASPHTAETLPKMNRNKIRFQGHVYTLIAAPVGHIERSTLIVLGNSVTGVVVYVGKGYFPLYSAKNWDIVYEEVISRISICKNLSELLEKGCQFYRLDQFQGMPAYYGSQALPELFALPITQPKETPASEITGTTTDDAPPNRGDNGRGRVTALTALQAATIVLPHAKADNNFMTAFTKESEGDRKFNDLAYLSQLEMEAQLAIERTVIGSEEEAIAYRHLRSIEEDIKYYGQPKPEPQPSPVIQQLETQMKELKADTLKLFKIEPFDQSILPTETDEPEQSATQSEPEPEGTIHWTTPLRGVIVGKKGATRQFYIRNDEIFIMLSADFTASEKKYPNNIRIQQIRNAVELGRTFNPRIFKISPNFERDTQVCNGGRIRQECDGRWWAWADGGVTGQPFPYENLATQYLERIASKQAQKQTPCIK